VVEEVRGLVKSSLPVFEGDCQGCFDTFFPHFLGDAGRAFR
jgi:hypothetical protein